MGGCATTMQPSSGQWQTHGTTAVVVIDSELSVTEDVSWSYT
ncbi:MAG: hypothetical protein ACLTMP_06025 [Eggerthella lenta]